jgi:hypothetical protein
MTATAARAIARRAQVAVALSIAVALLAAGSATVMGKGRDVLIAGDIAAGTASSREAATADLLERHSGIVITAGDNAYPDGSPSDFETRYDPTWGRYLGRTRPTPGNHDYHTPGAAAYFDYFGWRAGPRRSDGTGRGYHAFKVGSWLVFALDSEACLRASGCGYKSPQHRWLRKKLAASRARCTLAVWHRPVYSSGAHGDDPAARPLLRVLHRFGADVVVNGHEHDYERLARSDPAGKVDRRHGIRQFIVGTGGVNLRPKGVRTTPLSRVFQSTSHGVLRLRLRKDSYTWRFLPIAGQSFEDSGSGRCHGRPR